MRAVRQAGVEHVVAGEVVDQLFGHLAYERLEALDPAGGERRQEHPAELLQGRRVDVEGDQRPLVAERGQEHALLDRERLRILLRIPDVLVLRQEPESAIALAAPDGALRPQLPVGGEDRVEVLAMVPETFRSRAHRLPLTIYWVRYPPSTTRSAPVT